MTKTESSKTILKRRLAAGAAVSALVMLPVLPVFAGSGISTGGQEIVKTDRGDASLTIYGRVSPGIRYAHRPPYGEGNDRLAVDSGTHGGDRFGLIGDLGLPMGFRTGFVVERGLRFDSGQENDPWNRQAFASLSHEGYGTLFVGRVPTPQFRFIDLYDPFEDAFDPRTTIVYIYNAVFDNALMYDFPERNGFSLTIGGSKDTAGSRVADITPNPGDVRAIVFAPRYDSGPFSSALFLTYHRLKNDNGHPLDGESVLVFDLFTGYDFGPVKLTGMFGLREASSRDFIMDSAVNLNSQATRTVQWMGGVTVPLSEKKASVLAAYTGRRTSLVGEDSRAYSHMFSVGYTRVFRQYFRFYCGYAHIINSSAAKSAAGAVTLPGGLYQSLISVGISFSF